MLSTAFAVNARLLGSGATLVGHWTRTAVQGERLCQWHQWSTVALGSPTNSCTALDALTMETQPNPPRYDLELGSDSKAT